MGRMPTRVDKKTIRQWYERHQMGDTFTQIASDYSRDRRFVARVVKEYERDLHLDDAIRDSTMRELSIAFMKDHLQTLESCARDILEITVAPSIYQRVCVDYSRGSRLDVASRLIEKIGWQRTISPHPDMIQPVVYPPLPARALGTTIAGQEAQHIVEALQEHLPDLWEELESWTQTAKDYEKAWKDLERQARKKKIKGDLIERELFETGLEKCLRLLREGVSGPPPEESEADWELAFWLYQTGKIGDSVDIRDSLDKFRQNQDALEASYARLQDMLSSVQLRKALLARQCRHCPLLQGEGKIEEAT